MANFNFYIGAKVKYKKDKNPNPVDVIYEITDINVFVSPDAEKIKVLCFLKPIKDFPLTDGGFISKNNLTEVNVLQLELV